MNSRRGAKRPRGGAAAAIESKAPNVQVWVTAAFALGAAIAAIAGFAPHGARAADTAAPAAAAGPGGAASTTAAGPAAAVAAPRARRIDSAATKSTGIALGDLGLALLRETPGVNAVVSPLAVATVLGMVQSGAESATEREIEALFGGGRTGAQAMRFALPALSAQLREAVAVDGQQTTPVKQAARIWLDSSVARDVPAGFKRRLAQRHAADASVLSFADAEAARAQINGWAAEHTGGRVKELLPAGSVARSTQVTLTAALHFRSAWERPFEAARTETRAFTTAAGTPAQVPTLNGERAVAQVVVEGAQLYALPFASGFDLVIALPAGADNSGGGIDGLIKSLSGASLARWHGELKAPAPVRCSFAMPKFAFAPKAGSIKAPLQQLGVQRAFTDRAELRPMLGRAAGTAHVDDVHHAAGITIDEWGGEAVAAAAATVKPKSLAPALPACAVDRAFAFVVMHRASGAPLFLGRVGDPARTE
jgi:serpin B